MFSFFAKKPVQEDIEIDFDLSPSDTDTNLFNRNDPVTVSSSVTSQLNPVNPPVQSVTEKDVVVNTTLSATQIAQRRIEADRQWLADADARQRFREEEFRKKTDPLLEASKKYDSIVRSKGYTMPRKWEQDFPQGCGAAQVAHMFLCYAANCRQNNAARKKDAWYAKYNKETPVDEERWLEFIACARYNDELIAEAKKYKYLNKDACQFSLTWYRQLFYRIRRLGS